MNIVVYGTPDDFQECRDKFGDHHHYFSGHGDGAMPHDHLETVAFVFNTDGLIPAEIFPIKTLCAIFVDATSITLSDIVKRNHYSAAIPLYGFAGMPGFLNRPILEISLPENGNQVMLKKICSDLKTSYQVVKDQIGMITPRVVCMIINEAYYAASEGTASREDIDKAMKTGTNYPLGPFEWCHKIGLNHVFHLLVALRTAGGDRYEICPALKEEALLEQQNQFLH